MSLEIFWQEKQIPFTNTAEFASNNYAMITGNRSGFQQYLKTHVGDVYVIGYIYYSFAVCANSAVIAYCCDLRHS